MCKMGVMMTVHSCPSQQAESGEVNKSVLDGGAPAALKSRMQLLRLSLPTPSLRLDA